MKYLLPSLLAVLTIAPSIAAAAEDPVWHSDVEQAKKLAATSGRPLFVVFR